MRSNSKCVTRAQLNDSWWEGRADPPKVGRTNASQPAAADRVELSVIERVQKLSAELKGLALPDWNSFEGVDVPAGISRSMEHIPPECAQAACPEGGSVA